MEVVEVERTVLVTKVPIMDLPERTMAEAEEDLEAREELEELVPGMEELVEMAAP